jgi:hypothetical protein
LLNQHVECFIKCATELLFVKQQQNSTVLPEN